MTDNELLDTVKHIVGYGDKNTQKVKRRLVSEAGFKEVTGGKNGHYHLVHPRLGGYKVTLSCSPSHAWGAKFVSNIRHAMWKNAA